jgi:hypothetical protein
VKIPKFEVKGESSESVSTSVSIWRVKYINWWSKVDSRSDKWLSEKRVCRLL